MGVGENSTMARFMEWINNLKSVKYSQRVELFGRFLGFVLGKIRPSVPTRRDEPPSEKSKAAVLVSAPYVLLRIVWALLESFVFDLWSRLRRAKRRSR